MTPVGFFQALSRRDDVPWDKVTITLVDERWVDESSDRSNARLVRQNLLQGRAALATFVPLYQGGKEWLLPIPAVFVVKQDGTIAARHIDPDYRQRMEIDELLRCVSAI